VVANTAAKARSVALVDSLSGPVDMLLEARLRSWRALVEGMVDSDTGKVDPDYTPARLEKGDRKP
jgi:hypothetical protein